MFVDGVPDPLNVEKQASLESLSVDSKGKGVLHVVGSGVDKLGVGRAWASVSAWNGGGLEDEDRGAGVWWWGDMSLEEEGSGSHG